MVMQPHVTCIILNYNHWKMTQPMHNIVGIFRLQQPDNTCY